MHHRRLFAFFLCLAAFTLTACNIYGPFAANTTDGEIIEDAQRCLHAGDIDCAITLYNTLSNNNTKNEKLCLAYITKAGLTLESFLSLATGSGAATLMKTVANSLFPYSSDKESAAATAVTNCNNYSTSSGGGSNAQLLTLMAAVTDCAIRMAKTDTLQVTAPVPGETSCSATTSNTSSNGEVDPSDIGPDGASSTPSVSDPGMCSYDVAQCQTNLSAVSVTDIGNLDELYDNLPAELKSAAADAATRGAIRDLTE